MFVYPVITNKRPYKDVESTHSYFVRILSGNFISVLSFHLNMGFLLNALLASRIKHCMWSTVTKGPISKTDIIQG